MQRQQLMLCVLQKLLCSKNLSAVPHSYTQTPNTRRPVTRHPKTLTPSHARCFLRAVNKRWAFVVNQLRTLGHGVGTMWGDGGSNPFHIEVYKRGTLKTYNLYQISTVLSPPPHINSFLTPGNFPMESYLQHSSLRQPTGRLNTLMCFEM